MRNGVNAPPESSAEQLQCGINSSPLLQPRLSLCCGAFHHKTDGTDQGWATILPEGSH